MSLKEIYINAVQKVIDGVLEKDDLWELFEEHLKTLKDRNTELQQQSDEYKQKYKYLLGQLNSAHKEHKRLFG